LPATAQAKRSEAEIAAPSSSYDCYHDNSRDGFLPSRPLSTWQQALLLALENIDVPTRLQYPLERHRALERRWQRLLERTRAAVDFVESRSNRRDPVVKPHSNNDSTRPTKQIAADEPCR
jgi:hypothetical protein